MAKKTKKADGHAKSKTYFASIYSYPNEPLPQPFIEITKKIESVLKMPVIYLIQGNNGQQEIEEIGMKLRSSFVHECQKLPKNSKIALVIDSPGGYAKCAYQISTLLNEHHKFIALIPRYAKSAATLLILGAEKIFMGEHAELGPLDAQLIDRDREEVMSALDEVQALERLQAFGLTTFDQTMMLLSRRTGKKTETLIPWALDYSAKITQPLFDKIDAIHYTKMSRILKVAEEYAIRLLLLKNDEETAKKIASHLVEHYPEHGFVIDSNEAKTIGLPIEEPDDKLNPLLDDMFHFLDEIDGKFSVIGKIEIKP